MNNIPTQLQTKILKRGLSEEEFEEIINTYKLSKMKTGRPMSLDEIADEYREAYDRWLEGEPVQVLCKEIGCSKTKLERTFMHIGRLLNE